MVACAVADTGCGMSEEFIRASLFVPFQTTKKGGWGIGLYQAREIMTAHAGRIEVSSQEGLGTTITLLFPEEKS
jgi:signal transduction histidine kinase